MAKYRKGLKSLNYGGEYIPTKEKGYVWLGRTYVIAWGGAIPTFSQIFLYQLRRYRRYLGYNLEKFKSKP